MIIFPIMINGLMFFNLIPVSGNEVTWISSLSTFWGAIIGGVISGTLTLLGVRMSVKASFKGLNTTIEHQENEKFKETVGLKLSKLYEVKSIIYSLDRLLDRWKYSWDVNYNKVDRGTIEVEIAEYILPKLNLILELSSSVDYEFYFEIKSFVDKTRLNLIIRENFEDLTKVTDVLTKVIEDNHEKRLTDKYKRASGL